MRKRQRWLAIIVSCLLLVSSFPLAVHADDGNDPFPGMIQITSDWKGSVFGDVGGQDKITAANFGITENPDGTVTLRSANDRGKISSSTEGIAYYFKEVAPDANFELTATAHVDAWTAHNQVSFGLMLRGNVWDNEHGAYSGDYAALGAADQEMKALHKSLGGSLQKTDIFASANRPAIGEDYPLSIKKTGNILVVSIGDETKVISDYAGDLRYAGLYTARNTTVTFRDVKLQVDSPEEIELGEWKFSAFGSNTSESKNPPPVNPSETSVTLVTYGGKIAGSDEGLSFYYKELPATANFELRAKATVLSFNGDSSISTPNQKSFGLMLRDGVGSHGDSAQSTANYAAIGALDQVMKGFYKHQGKQTKLNPPGGIDPPAAGEVYDLRIKKSGSTYLLFVNGESGTVMQDDMFGSTIAAGVYAARDATVTFEDIAFSIENKTVSSITADASGMAKTTYLVGESLDLTGLMVTAHYSDGSEAILSPGEYIVTGFDSSRAGTIEITIHFNGASAKVPLYIEPLTVTSMGVKYFPAKTEYFLDDLFDPEGLVITAEYNNGFKNAELTSDKFSLWIDGLKVSESSPYKFTKPGNMEVMVLSHETPGMGVRFEITVKEALLKELEVRQQPVKKVYFLGDALNLDGLMLYAKYSDGSEVRLMKGEYTASPLDTSTPGSKTIVLTHKGLTASIPVTVKAKELTGIEMTGFPKTTFQSGDPFEAAGLKVSKVYDNGDREELTDYTLDTSDYDGQKAGVYDIRIIPGDRSIDPIVYQVTVRERFVPEWHATYFGQSTSAGKNTTEIRSDGSIGLVAADGGGKVTEDHDGITFYYTELDADTDNFVLSADIQVVSYAKSPHDGQESFGLMARDAIGVMGNSSVFASNIAAVGGYSGGTRSDNGTQLFVRTGVESPDGAGSQGIQALMLRDELPGPGNTHPAKPYRLTLAKTNSGFEGKLNDGKNELLFAPDILNVQDSKMYVGFFAARVASIVVSNADLTVTAASTDAPKVIPPAEPVSPSLEILSPDRTSDQDYRLILRSNVNGTVSVKQGQKLIAQDERADAGQRLSIPAKLEAKGDANFSIVFVPDDTQKLTSYDKMVRNFTVTMREYAVGTDIIVSPDGSSAGDGTVDRPLDIDTAIDFVKSGQRIILQDGRYVRSSKLEIPNYNDGKPGALKALVAAEGARPVIDFDKKSEGVVLSGNYWHVMGIDFTRSADNTKGFTVGGSHNIVENSRFYGNGDTGLQISRTDSSAVSITEWPSYNLILNSTSFDNRDPSDNNADGFAAKLTSGIGNVFRGCLAHNNIDDGWDLYTKAGSGAIGAVVIENSAAFNNGFLTDGTVGAGDKNGFKLGGEGIHVPHVIRGSIAFGNGAYGFTSNSNPGVIAINNIGFNNRSGNLSFTTYSNITPDFKLNGFISYRTADIGKDQYPASLRADNNYLFDGTNSVNKAGKALTDANFVSLTPVTDYERDENGNIIWGDFLKFIDFNTPDPGHPSNPGGGGSSGGSGDSGGNGGNGSSSGSAGSSPDTAVGTPGNGTPEDSTDNGTLPPARMFTDVTGHWAEASIREAISLGFINGYPDGTFKPNGAVTRAEFAVMLAKALKLADADGNAASEPVAFTDQVEIRPWARDAVAMAINAGIIEGYEDGSFRPSGNVTRAEMVTMLARAAGLPIKEDAATQFADDGQIPAWAKGAAAAMQEHGIVTGRADRQFAPNDTATRAEAVTMILRLLGFKN
ncbi:bacterial Ig-like domain-containing protein [Paenibacillus sp. DYY-L-2]|uniref:bacterial Ig-like domain-containing protein n=1 Tax=Paenibacillus sp. DYY-L-2 TaxID=3447013 RepID=UPI003F4F507F